MLIACVRTGDKYGDDYILRLQRGIKRHLPKDERPTFVCLTDRPVEGVLCEPLTENLPTYWSKLELFKLDEPLIYFDLDVVITGSLAPLFDWHGFGIIKDYWQMGFNSSVMKLTGNERHVFDDFMRADMRRCPQGDQQWITEQMPEGRIFPKEWFPSYKVDHCQEKAPDGAIACIFHGNPKPHDIASGWVKELWV